MPVIARAKLGSLIEKVVTVPLALLTGVIVSVTLLSCSAGPYLIALVYMSKLEFVKSLFLLFIYNVIFASPLIIMLITMSIVEGHIRVIRRKRKRVARLLSLLEGTLLILLAIYLLISEWT